MGNIFNQQIKRMGQNLMSLKRTVLILLCIIFMISGCQYHPESSEANSISAVSSPVSGIVVSETSSMVNSVVNSAETTIDLIDQYAVNELTEILSKHSENRIERVYTVFEYPSPDKTQKFIEVKANEGDADYWAGDRNFIFLNDLDNFIYAYEDNYNETVGAVWIDNDTAAIAAEFIVNLKTGERTDMGTPAINHWYEGLLELKMTSGLLVKELDSLIYITDYDMVFYIFRYSLKDGTWTELGAKTI